MLSACGLKRHVRRSAVAGGKNSLAQPADRAPSRTPNLGRKNGRAFALRYLGETCGLFGDYCGCPGSRPDSVWIVEGKRALFL
jgi:hypothetical protein